MSEGNSLTLSKKYFLTQLGFDHDSAANGWPSTIKLAVGGVDPRTRGAVAVSSELTYNAAAQRIELTIDRWRMRPNGEQLRHNLFQFTFVEAANDSIVPQSLWVMGRPLYDAGRDGDPLAVSAGVMRNVATGRSAASYIIRALRRDELPETARIFRETGLPEAMGENLPLVGQSTNGGFDFDVFEAYAKPANDDLILPADMARALLGEDTNSIDAHQRLGRERITTAVHPQNRSEFAARYVAANDNDGESGAVASSITIEPIAIPDDMRAVAIPEFSSMRLEPSSNDNRRILQEFKFLGVDILRVDHDLRMKVIGVVNRAKQALRRRDYPRILDYAAEYDLLGWIDAVNAADLADPPPPEGRMVVESKGGNNTADDIAEGYSHQPNGNCKVIEMQWLDREGRLRHVGALHDIGLFLPPHDVANEGAVADVVEELAYIRDIFLTHRHLDHIDGAIPYIAKGYFKGKIIHAAPEVLRALREKLNAFEIPAEYHPAYDALQGRGWVHIKDDDGIVRLSVGYSVDGTPHTARSTPFIYVARNGSEVIDSYLNPGDMRFGRHNAEGYRGFKPDADYLDKYFFQHWQELLLADDPSIDASVLQFPTLRMDIDGTSIRKPGFAPTDWECEENQYELFEVLNDILPGRLNAVGQISTNEMGFEHRLRLATRLGRDVTASGANMERTARTANVMGVNKLRVEVQKTKNNQAYLDYVFRQRIDKRLRDLRSQIDGTAEGKERTRLEREWAVETRVLDYFEQLCLVKQSNRRFEMRDKLEAAFAGEYGEHRHLGSIYTAIAAKSSRRMLRQPECWLTLETGTQGTNVEIDSSMSKRSYGASRFDMPAGSKPSARPIPPQKTILCLSQVAIPGNDKKQRDLVSRHVMRGYAVVLATHDGYEIHGLSLHDMNRVFRALNAIGHGAEIENDAYLKINGRPIHAPGHGFAGDTEEWLRLVKPIFPMLQHTGDPLAFPELREMSMKILGRTAYYFDNFCRVTTQRTDDALGWLVKTMGRSCPSIIRFIIDRKSREYHGGHIEAERITNMNGAASHRHDGFMASVTRDGVYRRQFATLDGEAARRRAALRKGAPPQPVAYNRKAPAPEQRYRGPDRPGAHRRNLPMKPGARLRLTPGDYLKLLKLSGPKP
ncbi:MAG: hypothetical protein KGI37_06130 [Alphaproteobacteria bacterium]|nr:hypothetical protein [Alphaproteobacteria bacterium]